MNATAEGRGWREATAENEVNGNGFQALENYSASKSFCLNLIRTGLGEGDRQNHLRAK
jgi:hypothetical protein